MTRFGDFAPLCTQVPSYPWCNLFYRQLSRHAASVLANTVSANPDTAPVGIAPVCGIPRVGSGSGGAHHSIGNIANLLACALSLVLMVILIMSTHRRKAAVGRLEMVVLLCVYGVTLPLQIVSTGSFLRQGSTALVVITALHAGAVGAVFWALLANALVATQVVEDGTLSSLIPFMFFSLCFFVVPTYISLDVGLGLTNAFRFVDNQPKTLHSIPLFVLTSVWPGVAIVLYFGIMTYVVIVALNQFRPMWFFVLAAVLFVLGQLDYFLLNKIICKASSAKVDGSFVATILETAAVVVLYLAWKSITEDAWEEEDDYDYTSS